MSALLNFVRCHLAAIVLVGLVVYGIVYRDKILRTGAEVVAVSSPVGVTEAAGSTADEAASMVATDGVVERPRQEGMDLARKAYWEGKFDQAIQGYRELAEKHPQNADVLGELGDVFYQQGNKEAAGEVYYNAALLLINQDNKARAERVLAVLRLLNSSYADQLASRFQG